MFDINLFKLLLIMTPFLTIVNTMLICIILAEKEDK